MCGQVAAGFGGCNPLTCILVIYYKFILFVLKGLFCQDDVEANIRFNLLFMYMIMNIGELM